jgi:hypothetical protein
MLCAPLFAARQEQLLFQLRNMSLLSSMRTQAGRATNQTVIAGNYGAVRSGPQTANPTNVG